MNDENKSAASPEAPGRKAGSTEFGALGLQTLLGGY